MPSASVERLVPVLLTAALVVGLVAAQPAGAIQATVDGPGEVVAHDDVVLVVAITSDEAPSDPITNYTIELAPADADEHLAITFAADGTVQTVSPPRGVVGTGDIRVNRLRRDLAITPVESDDGAGYGYGYGYGYGDGTIATFEVVLPSAAFQHGTYEVRASVNTAESTGLGRSTAETFTVLVPAGHDPPRDDEVPPGDAVDADDDTRAGVSLTGQGELAGGQDGVDVDDGRVEDGADEEGEDGEDADATDGSPSVDGSDDDDAPGRSQGNGPPAHAVANGHHEALAAVHLGVG